MVGEEETEEAPSPPPPPPLDKPYSEDLSVPVMDSIPEITGEKREFKVQSGTQREKSFFLFPFPSFYSGLGWSHLESTRETVK